MPRPFGAEIGMGWGWLLLCTILIKKIFPGTPFPLNFKSQSKKKRKNGTGRTEIRPPPSVWSATVRRPQGRIPKGRYTGGKQGRSPHYRVDKVTIPPPWALHAADHEGGAVLHGGVHDRGGVLLGGNLRCALQTNGGRSGRNILHVQLRGANTNPPPSMTAP